MCEEVGRFAGVVPQIEKVFLFAVVDPAVRRRARGAGVKRHGRPIFPPSAGEIEERPFQPGFGRAPQQRYQAHAVERPARRQGHAGEVEQGGQHIHMLGDLVDDLARPQLARPADEARHPHAAFEYAGLAPAHPAVETPGVRTVVAGEKHEGVRRETEFVELRQQPARVVIEILDHRIDRSLHRREAALAVFGKQIRRRLHRGVAGVEWHVTEERLPPLTFDERERGVGDHIGDETLAWRDHTVVFQLRIEIVRKESAAKAKELVEALAARRGGLIGAVVPLAKTARDVSRRFQRLGDRDLVTMHDFEGVRGVDHPQSQMMPSGEQRRPRGRADGADVEVIEFHALAFQFVEHRRIQAIVSVATQVTPPHVVGQDEENVRAPLGGECRGRTCE